MPMNRRDLLKYGTASLIASQIPWPLRQFGNQAFAAQNSANASPLASFSGSFGAGKFLGDNEAMPHEILWNKAGFLAKLGGIPKPSLSCDVVVIGGGIAGLLAAHRAPQRDVIVLEQDPRFGGNSKGEIFRGPNGTNIMSQGAAYICKPEAGDSSDLLLKELGLKGRVEEGAPYLLKNVLNDNVWANSTAGARAKADLERVESKLRAIFETEFPEIPFSGNKALDQKTLTLDAITFEVWLKQEFGELDPFVLEYLQIYCWSSFNASISELSAAQALNFIAAEVDGVLALPGGNAAIAEGL
ncbi:MAG: FAD-dependent oxidoreductase, partial [Proteobacteria bacterium]